MYNIIIIFKVLCNDYYDEIDKYNKFVPDYGTYNTLRH